jgi:RNA recognition motif-containing protein
MNSKLYVGNLSEMTTEDTLWSLFSESGTVVTVDLIKDRVSLRSKGYAFIVMSNPAEAVTAVEILNGRSVDNSQIRVTFAQRSE